SENVAKNETPPRPPSRVDAYEVMAGKRPAPADIDRFHRFESEFLGGGFEADTAVELTRRLLFDYAKADLEIPSFLEKAKFAILRGSVHVLGEEILETRPAWALFGAPGSGKTSLCVKLAVALKRRRRPVGLVSLD